MSSERIKNIVFDIGNVVVRWSPEEIISGLTALFNENILLLKWR